METQSALKQQLLGAKLLRSRGQRPGLHEEPKVLWWPVHGRRWSAVVHCRLCRWRIRLHVELWGWNLVQPWRVVHHHRCPPWAPGRSIRDVHLQSWRDGLRICARYSSTFMDYSHARRHQHAQCRDDLLSAHYWQRPRHPSALEVRWSNWLGHLQSREPNASAHCSSR